MSGTGRGRGWLNIKQAPTVGTAIGTSRTSNEETMDGEMVNTEESIEKYLGYMDKISEIPSKYKEALRDFESPMRKNSLPDKMKNEYKFDDEELRQCIIYAIQKYLCSSTNFRIIENASDVHRKALLNTLQCIYYDCRHHLLKSNVKAFVHFIILLGGVSMHINPRAILYPFHAFTECCRMYMELLLPEHIPTIAKMIHQILCCYRTDPDKPRIGGGLDAGIINRMRDVVRTAICAMDDPPSRYWLHLIMDLWTAAPFQTVPSDTLDFYAKHLGEEQIAYFRTKPDFKQPLLVDVSQSLDGFVSDVSVLQIDDSANGGQNTSRDGATHVNAGGRAILGAGARNHRKKNRPHQHPPKSPQGRAVLIGWSVASYASDGSGQDASIGGAKQPPRDVPRSHSSWNHDDRC